MDCVKFNDADSLMDVDETPDDMHPASSMGCIMLVFRIAHADLEPHGHRDFCLVRLMHPADRSGGAEFPRQPCEVGSRNHMLDDRGTRNKLGRLWTWHDVRPRLPHTQPGGRRPGQPSFRVLSAEEIRETVAVMPRWLPGSIKWSITTGVHENRYLMDSRQRPPFVDTCSCLDAAE